MEQLERDRAEEMQRQIEQCVQELEVKAREEESRKVQLREAEEEMQNLKGQVESLKTEVQ